MLIGFFSVLLILAVGYAYLREGIFTAFVMMCNALLAGVVAFNYWEPLADMVDPVLAGTPAQGYEDCVIMVFLYAAALSALRTLTNSLAPTEIAFPQLLHRAGGFFFGLLTGYLAVGFLVCALQTLPWHENFMYFDPEFNPSAPGAAARRLLPPDRVWLALMSRAGAYTFANSEDLQAPPNPNAAPSPTDKYQTFDKYGTFETRYARYRRYNDKREALFYQGEFDVEIGRPAP